ncbi:hypothetical protein ACFPRL_32670 [Pseudoclavibacter helvolus]
MPLRRSGRARAAACPGTGVRRGAASPPPTRQAGGEPPHRRCIRQRPRGRACAGRTADH